MTEGADVRGNSGIEGEKAERGRMPDSKRSGAEDHEWEERCGQRRTGEQRKREEDERQLRRISEESRTSCREGREQKSQPHPWRDVALAGAEPLMQFTLSVSGDGWEKQGGVSKLEPHNESERG
ncbi:hypothetical protein NDU88_001346 [Pleurodeles waltl]|uniref:Uncharacterized protein n=1 Tax=Pleurodeles waltl TaxID=8319 RepID=A0AAV7Q9U6_PLEWA|nr:hypothetical protein NDU88_001346 [Pleurodeles waltl]